MVFPPLPPKLDKGSLTRDVKSILERRGDEVLPGYAYKLADDLYGLDAPFVEPPTINESEMSMLISYADGNNRDGVGDRLEIGGIDCIRHKMNPVVLLDHGKYVQLPIGLAEDPETNLYLNFIDPVSKVAKVKCFFYRGNCDGKIGTTCVPNSHALLVEQIFDLACKKFLRGGSIGYQVKRGMQLPGDYETGTPPGIHLLSTLMLEASLVVMPANKDTVVKSVDLAREVLALPKVCGKKLDPYLVKSFAAIAKPHTKTTVGYEGKFNTASRSVPLASNLTKTNIPPAKWKPGQGATKSQIPGDLAFWEEEQMEAEHQKHLKGLRGKYKNKGKGKPDGKCECGAKIPAGETECESCKYHRGDKNAGKKEFSRETRPDYDNYDMSSSGNPAGPVDWEVVVDGRAMSWFGTQARANESKEEVQRKYPNARVEVRRTKDLQKALSWLNNNLGGALVPPPAAPGTKKKKCCNECKKGKPCCDKKHYTKSAAFLLMDDVLAALNQLGEDGFNTVMDLGGDLQKLVQRLFTEGKKPEEIAKEVQKKVKELRAKKKAEPTPDGANWRGSGKKSLDLRQKHRSLKQLRRRVKGSRAGVTVMNVDAKNVDAAKELAESKGCKFHHQGIRNGKVRVKLVGDNDAMDEVAKSFGVAMRVLGKKNMPDQVVTGDTNTMPDGRELQSVGGGSEEELAKRRAQAAANDKKRTGTKDLIKGWAAEYSGSGVGNEDFLDGANTRLQKGPGSRNQNPHSKESDEYKDWNAGWDKTDQREKSLTGTKSLMKNTKTKELPPEEVAVEEDVVAEPTPEMGGGGDLPEEADLNQDGMVDEAETEKYSAQVLRRLHQDSMLLLEQYDEMLSLLEEENVKGHISKKLEAIAEELDVIEGLWQELHADLPPLDGAGDKDMDMEGEAPGEEAMDQEVEEGVEPLDEEIADEDNAEPMNDQDRLQGPALEADSEEEEVPDPDEVVEGMMDEEVKSLRNRLTKTLRKQYSSKAVNGKKKDLPEDPASDTPVPEAPENEVVAAEPGMPEVEASPFDKALEPHEHMAVGEASDFAKQLTSEHEFGNEHRMKSYYYHKCLAPLGMDDKFMDYHPEVNADVGQIGAGVGGAKDFPPMDEAAVEGAQVQAPGEKSFMHHRKALGAASKYFKGLTSCHDFGEPHRQQAMVHHTSLSAAHKAMDPMAAAQGEVENVEPDGIEPMDSPEASAPVPDVGEVQEKDIIGNVPETKPELKIGKQKDIVGNVPETKPEMKIKGGPGSGPKPKHEVQSHTADISDSPGNRRLQGERDEREAKTGHQERTGKGPGSRPMKVPDEPTSHVPKKDLHKDLEAQAIKQQILRTNEEAERVARSVQQLVAVLSNGKS